MEMLEGIEWLKPTLDSDSQNSILRLHKALYSLKEAPRLWYQHIDSFLGSIGLGKSDNDPNLYFTKDQSMFLVVYVDDILLLSKSLDLMCMFKAKLAGKYKLNDLGYASQFLGLEITTGSDYLFLNQQCFIQKVLNQFEMADCNSVSTSLQVKSFIPTTPECDKGNQAEY